MENVYIKLKLITFYLCFMFNHYRELNHTVSLNFEILNTTSKSNSTPSTMKVFD